MIKIELGDLPEFKRDLKITITLQKDEEGVLRESVEALSDTSSSSSVGISSDLKGTSQTKKRTVKKTETTPEPKKMTGDGNFEKDMDSFDRASLSNSTSPDTNETKNKTAQPKKGKVSGNLMGLEF